MRRWVVNLFHKAGELDASLTPREREVLRLLARGLAYKEIAAVLQRSQHTVETHVASIYRKLHVHSGREAMAILASGLLSQMNI